MGFLDRLKSSQAQQNEDWKVLSDLAQLEAIDAESNNMPIVLFKHSTTCGISAGAKHRLEVDWENIEGDFQFYYLDLLAHRDISNAIAEKWKVRHESPQAIIIKNGEATYNASHGRINANEISRNL